MDQIMQYCRVSTVTPNIEYPTSLKNTEINNHSGKKTYIFSTSKYILRSYMSTFSYRVGWGYWLWKGTYLSSPLAPSPWKMKDRSFCLRNKIFLHSFKALAPHWDVVETQIYLKETAKKNTVLSLWKIWKTNHII